MSEAPIKVIVPAINLRIEDLAYLKSLSQGVRCYPKRATRDRCVFLGLVEEGIIPVCHKALAEFKNKRPTLEIKAKAALDKKDWDKLHDIVWELRHMKEPEPEKGMLLTKSGKKLLANGHTSSQTAKKACL